jgi:hypothetical protein
MQVYVRYQDDGPVGICGQACSITNPWDQLHIFGDEKKAHEFARKIEKYAGRKNARITASWVDNQETMYPSVQRHG